MKFSSLLNPSELNNSEIKTGTAVSGLFISGLTFMLLFILTGIDKNEAILLPALKGVFFGTIGILILALFIYILVKLSDKNNSLLNVIIRLSLCYTASIIFTLAGFVLKILFGWQTSVSLGMSGVLFTFSPLISVINLLTDGKRIFGIFIISFAGLYIIFFWALLNKMF